MGAQAASPKLARPLVLGLSADSGRPLKTIPLNEVSFPTTAAESQDHSEQLARKRQVGVFGMTAEAGDVNELENAGWGVVFPKNVDAKIEEALQPLLRHRKETASPFAIFKGDDGYLPGDSAREWIERKKLDFGVVDPERGVPFYLLLVGSPEEIPYQFQYDLDIYWGVGRIHFRSPTEYRLYADSVVTYEKAQEIQQTRRISLFATKHDFDEATDMFVHQVADPMSDPTGPHGAVGSTYKFALDSVIGDAATKQQLTDIFAGKAAGGPPALLFTGSHGMSFRADDPRQSDCQGALVCSDWQGYGHIDERYWFEASDVPTQAKVHGLIYFMFACYSAGYPQWDDFDSSAQVPRTIAQVPALSRLPQTLLAHPTGGALAVLGHVDRAWAYSFVNSKGKSQPDGFRDVIARICRGERVGSATDSFNVKWAALSAELLGTLKDRDRGVSVADEEIATRWIARNDARDYIVIGDPAVRLRTTDLSNPTSLQ